jgi:hypothetical protein
VRCRDCCWAGLHQSFRTPEIGECWELKPLAKGFTGCGKLNAEGTGGINLLPNQNHRKNAKPEIRECWEVKPLAKGFTGCGKLNAEGTGEINLPS